LEIDYLFDQVGAFLAFFKPGFFLSFLLGSLFKTHCGFKVVLNSLFRSIIALASANLIASACHEVPPHLITISPSNLFRYSGPRIVIGERAASMKC